MANTSEPLERLLSVRQVAAIFGVSEKTVRRMIGDGRLAATRVGRQLRIAPAALRRLVGGGL